LGWLVFPLHSIRDGKCTCRDPDNCKHPGKHPRTRHGFKDATKDPRRIQRWWKRHPNANVGIATGVGSGIFVLDVDPRHGGDSTLEALLKELGPLPNTPVANTGGGGQHYLFAHSGGWVKSRQAIAAGIDIRGDGGYIVVAPSKHESGGRYVWLPSFEPWSDAKPAALPIAWLQWLRSAGFICRGLRTSTSVSDALGEVPCVKAIFAAKVANADAISRRGASGDLPNTNGERYREIQSSRKRESEAIQGFSGGEATTKPSPVSSLDELTDDEKRTVKRAISQNLPRAPGERNLKLFGFARAIAGIPRLQRAGDAVVRAIVKEYFDAASPRTSGTHCFEDYWDEFTYGLARVRFPGEVNMIEIIETVAGRPPHPVCAARDCDERRRVLLLGLCAELQKLQGDAPFFLSYEMAAKLLRHVGHSTERMQVHRMLHGFVRDGLLKIEKNGDRHNATRWRFLWKSSDAGPCT